jgi:hypothetical protein
MIEEDKIKKKRGRKPKPKVEEYCNLLPKKRGRKKKCEIGVDYLNKISGFTENSIDTKDNKIQFMNNEVQFMNNDNNTLDNDKKCENIAFGNIKIIKKNTFKSETEDLIKIFHKRNNKCEIDLSIYNNEDKDKTNESKNKKNLYDFYEEIKQNKNKKTKNKRNHFEQNNKNDIVILKCFRGQKTLWPEKSDVWCWWCCHPFESIPRFIPTKYDPIRDRFKVIGNFCSWNCAKAYFIFDKTSKLTLGPSIFTLLVKKINGIFIDINCAPPRQALKCFGGNMDIEKFRNISTNEFFDLHTNKMELDENYTIKCRGAKP